MFDKLQININIYNDIILMLICNFIVTGQFKNDIYLIFF